MEGHFYLLNSVVWSPDGKYLVNASVDAIVKIWCVE
ncbi:MAG: hypothetical protein J6P97_03775 [Bacteroidales bacterium]|nr:hypothetical protein [Bacteroidales bacterium]